MKRWGGVKWVVFTLIAAVITVAAVFTYELMTFEIHVEIPNLAGP